MMLSHFQFISESLVIRVSVNLLCSLLILLLSTTSRAEQRPFNVVATTGMIGSLLEELMHSSAQINTLMSAGVDPHLYKPTRNAVVAFGQSDVVVMSGLHLEGRLGFALERVKLSGREILSFTDGIPRSLLLSPPEFEGAFDPHVWMDPVLWRQAVLSFSTYIREKNLVPEQELSQALTRLLESFDHLVSCAHTAFATIPPEARVLVTAHDAFNYFGRRFQIEVRAIQGLSTESEAGLRDLEHLISLVVKRKIPSVFVESTISPRTISALRDGARAQGHEVKMGGELFADAMGKPGTYEGTYIGMMDHNIATIVRGLGGLINERGCFGKLTLHEGEK